MKRLLITGPKQTVFEECPMPSCAPDGLLIRARTTAISQGTELRVFRCVPVDEAGEFLHERVPFALPTENGYSMVGEVIEAGSQTAGFAVGDRVFGGAPHRQVAAVPASLAVKLPDGIPEELGVFLNIAEVAHIALRRGNPAPGANVAIVGQGVVGLSALAYCRAFGFRTAVLDLDPHRLAIAGRIGADLAVTADAPDAAARVIEHFDGEGADLVIEAASVWPAVRLAMEVARPNGTIVVAARHTTVPAFNPVGHPFLGKRLTLLTSYGYEPEGQRWDRRHSIRLTLDLMRRGRLDLSPMITHRFAWHEIPEAYQRMNAGEAGMVGTVIDWKD